MTSSASWQANRKMKISWPSAFPYRKLTVTATSYSGNFKTSCKILFKEISCYMHKFSLARNGRLAHIQRSSGSRSVNLLCLDSGRIQCLLLAWDYISSARGAEDRQEHVIRISKERKHSMKASLALVHQQQMQLNRKPKRTKESPRFQVHRRQNSLQFPKLRGEKLHREGPA